MRHALRKRALASAARIITVSHFSGGNQSTVTLQLLHNYSTVFVKFLLHRDFSPVAAPCRSSHVLFSGLELRWSPASKLAPRLPRNNPIPGVRGASALIVVTVSSYYTASFSVTMPVILVRCFMVLAYRARLYQAAGHLDQGAPGGQTPHGADRQESSAVVTALLTALFSVLCCSALCSDLPGNLPLQAIQKRYNSRPGII